MALALALASKQNRRLMGTMAYSLCNDENNAAVRQTLSWLLAVELIKCTGTASPEEPPGPPHDGGEGVKRRNERVRTPDQGACLVLAITE